MRETVPGETPADARSCHARPERGMASATSSTALAPSRTGSAAATTSSTSSRQTT